MDTFKSEDEFYRIIKRSNPPSFICKDGTISSALFKNKDEIGNPGISVDCQDGRSLDEVISFMKKQFPSRLKAVVGFAYCVVMVVGAVVFRSPNQKNKYHAEIFKNEDKEHISNTQAWCLAKNCKLYYFDKDVQWVN